MEDDGILLNLAGLDDSGAQHEYVSHKSSNTSRWNRRNKKNALGMVSASVLVSVQEEQ